MYWIKRKAACVIISSEKIKKSKRTSTSALNFVVQNFMELRKENVTPLFLAGDLEGFKTFLLAIFYIGKGKRSRPYCHLYEAISQLNTPKQTVSIHQSLLRMYKEVEGWLLFSASVFPSSPILFFICIFRVFWHRVGESIPSVLLLNG